MQTRTKESRKRLHSLILLIAFTAVLLIVSTYAWFTAQTDVNVSNIRGKVEVAEGLEISLDGGVWTQVIDLGAADVSLTQPRGTTVNGTVIEYGPNTNTDNVVPAEITPASTSGENADGDKNLAMLVGSYNGELLSSISVADEKEAQGFYAFNLFVKNTSKTGTVNDLLQLNSDSWAWVLPEGAPIGTYVGNADSGLQNTIRVALARYGADSNSDIPATSSHETVKTNTADDTITAVSIWEPNSNTHSQYIVDKIVKEFDESMGEGHGYFENANNDANLKQVFFTYALNKTAVNAANGVDVYNWATDNTYLTETKTVQTVTESTTSPYLDKHYDLKDTNEQDFKLAANAITKLRVYVWIEGQDPDCENYASQGGGIEINLGLAKNLDSTNSTTKREDIKTNGGVQSFTDNTTVVQPSTPVTANGGGTSE